MNAHDQSVDLIRGSDLKPRAACVLVKRDGDAYVFMADGGPGWDYDITDAACRDPGSALRWIEHLAQKSWVTPAHLEQFARLAADQFKAPY